MANEEAGQVQEKREPVETGRDVKKLSILLGGAGKRTPIFKKLVIAIALVWLIVWATNRGYPFWPGLAGVLTIPLLLAALVVDNLYKEE